jgi:hypothetical protein
MLSQFWGLRSGRGLRRRRTAGRWAGLRPLGSGAAFARTADPEAEFAFDPDTGTITDYLGARDDVRIPEAIGGKTVARIGKKAFRFKRIRRIVIPAGVTSIGESAFADNNLERVVIPANVASIGACAFAYNRLKQVFVLHPAVSFEEQVFKGNGEHPDAELTIFGYEGSSAAAYAARNRHRFELLGFPPHA